MHENNIKKTQHITKQINQIKSCLNTHVSWEFSQLEQSDSLFSANKLKLRYDHRLYHLRGIMMSHIGLWTAVLKPRVWLFGRCDLSFLEPEVTLFGREDGTAVQGASVIHINCDINWDAYFR